MRDMNIFNAMEAINRRPEPFEFYTAADLWTDEHTSEKMLSFHLNGEIDVSSRRTTFIERSVEWIISYFNVGGGSIVADFGCGPGLYTIRLARTGARVTGIDFSRRSTDYAQQAAEREGLSVGYINQNYLEFETEQRFDLVLMIMCDFCALGPEQRAAMLTGYHTLLKPGGHVLLDVYSLAAFDRREEVALYEENLLAGFWSDRKYYGFMNTFKYEQEKVVLDKYTIVEEDRTRTVYNWLQYFSPEALEREFVRCGLEVEALFGDVAGSPYDPGGNEFAVVARKKS